MGKGFKSKMPHPPSLAKMAQQDTTGDVPYSLLNQEEGNAPDDNEVPTNPTPVPLPVANFGGRRSHPFILYLVPFAVVTLCASLYYLYYEAQLSPTTSCRNDLCTVLVVVDMQNDYCLECNSTTVSPWAVSGLPAVAHHINRLQTSDAHLIDFTIYTQDWLPSTSPFLPRNTYGSAILDALQRPKDPSTFTTFTKDSDDWMNTLGPKQECAYCTPSYDDQYHFALNGESTPSQPTHPTLQNYLSSKGYAPAKTRLVVVGTAENRCVMKGSLHAINDEYQDVILYYPGVSGTHVTTPENWVPGQNAPRDSCEASFQVSRCTPAENVKWREQVYLGHKGGPTSRDALWIMRNATEHVVYTQVELLRLLV